MLEKMQFLIDKVYKGFFLRTKCFLSKNVELCVFILIFAGNIFFGGKGITEKQTFPFFSWSLFSYVNPFKKEYYIILPELGDKNLVNIVNTLESKGKSVQVRYVVNQCAKYYDAYGQYSIYVNKKTNPECVNLINEEFIKIGATYGIVKVTESLSLYLARYLVDKKRKSTVVTTLVFKP